MAAFASSPSPSPPPNLRVLSVGGNAVSAFLSWRLQATNSCDVTLVWKSGYEQVSQYGVSFKSKQFGNERFKPRHVVRTPEEGVLPDQPFDYVILCVKALPDVYDLASVIESVVTPRHTCILVNTSNTVGVEAHLETRFPANVILSLVSHIDLAQTGVSEFEHLGGSSKMWVGPATSSQLIPEHIKTDMASALAITLGTGQVDCQVSDNIRQQQYERMIGPIAFHPISILFDCPNHAQLIEKVGVRQLICGIIDELITLATAQKCSFPPNFRDTVIEQMTAPTDKPSTMYQDFQARRPMEIEMYLGSPIKFAQEEKIKIPRIETIYSIIHHTNIVNQQRPQQQSQQLPAPHLRPSQSANHLKTQSGIAPPPGQRPMMNGSVRGPPSARYRGPGGPPAGPQPPTPNGMPRPPMPMNGPRAATQTDPDDPNLEEFSHLVLYDDHDMGTSPGSTSQAELALRERELALRQRELKLKEREMQMRRGKSASRARARYDEFDDDDGDDDDFISDQVRPPMPHVDPDMIDMMSVTSRRTRRGQPPGKNQIRRDPESMANRPPSAFSKYFGARRKQASERIVEQMPTLHDTLWDNPMMPYASNRYANVDRTELQESRANSMTSNFMPPPSMSRRPSAHSPGAPPPMPVPRGVGGSMNGGVRPPLPQLTQQDLYNGAPGPSPMPRPSPGMPRGPNSAGHNGNAYGYPGTPGQPPQPQSQPQPGTASSAAGAGGPVPSASNTAVEQPQQMNGVPAQAGVSSQFPFPSSSTTTTTSTIKPSSPYPSNFNNVRSLTGSASASAAGSGDSGSGNLDFNSSSNNENSATSSQISLRR